MEGGNEMAADRRMMATPDTMPAFPRIDAPAGFNVRIDGVVKAYGRHEVLKGISLEVHAGECVALLGPNGAGKTTLFKLILGLVRPGGGQVSIDGMDPAARAFRAYRSEIGFLPENVSFHQAMTGREVLAFYARLKGASASECPVLLERVGLADVAKRRVGTYSKGMRQRLGLAQALLGHPRLLFLDEPTTGLDPSLRRQFYDLIEELRRNGTTALISSHALSEIEARTDRVAIMKAGLLVACGTLDDLRREAGLLVEPLHVAPGDLRQLPVVPAGQVPIEL